MVVLLLINGYLFGVCQLFFGCWISDLVFVMLQMLDLWFRGGWYLVMDFRSWI